LHLADAVAVLVVLPDDGDESQLRVTLAAGPGTERLIGASLPGRDSQCQIVMRTGEARLVGHAVTPGEVDERAVLFEGYLEWGPSMVVPIDADGVVGAVLVLRASHQRPFTPGELEMASTFVRQAAVAVELAEARKGQQTILLLEDRARIARDLHDHVIQQLFATGMAVQGVASVLTDQRQSAALEGAVDNLDAAIKQVRASIFQLKPRDEGLRSLVLETVGEVRSSLSFEPYVTFHGPVDTVATAALVNDVAAVVREGLTNVARHAQAANAWLRIAYQNGELVIELRDDGRGMGESGRNSGLENMRRRAQAWDGGMEISTPDAGGTQLTWRVPAA